MHVCLCVGVCTCAAACGDQERVSDVLEELQDVVSHPRDAGNGTLALCKSCTLLTTHPSL